MGKKKNVLFILHLVIMVIFSDAPSFVLGTYESITTSTLFLSLMFTFPFAAVILSNATNSSLPVLRSATTQSK